MKFKAFVKKYHLIAYLISVTVIVIMAASVKFYRYLDHAAVYGLDNVRDAYSYFNILLAFILVMFTILFYFLVVKKTDIAKSFLVIALTMGTLFILAMPPNTPADEESHVYTITKLTNGILGIEKSTDGCKALYRREDVESGFTREINIHNFSRTLQSLKTKADSREYVLFEVETFVASPTSAVLYFPAMVGVCISKICGLGTAMMYFLSRFLLLAAYAVIGYFAIKKIPTGKGVLALIMAMPTSLARAACISQEAILHGCGFLFMAYVFYFILSENKIRIKETVITVLAATVLLLGKGGVYIPLFLLLFLIPKEKFGEKVKYPAVVSIAVVYSLIIFILANPSLLKDLVGSDSQNGYDLAWTDESGYTLKMLITSPAHTVKMFFTTIVSTGGELFAQMISGGYGWLQFNSSSIIVALTFALIIINALGSENQMIILNKKQKIITGVSAGLTILLITLSMWLFWTPISYQVITGLQGRYYILTLLPLMLLICNHKIKVRGNVEKAGCLCISAILIFTILEIWTKNAL